MSFVALGRNKIQALALSDGQAIQNVDNGSFVVLTSGQHFEFKILDAASARQDNGSPDLETL